ncbi:MAG: DNA polymerase III subunit beta [Oscillospiraceae bacterium]|jgi:DNA polymerase-3 subunit beta|nr:DNA polymerase III subunit beta [Oscillospiraceae bacterium]
MKFTCEKALLVSAISIAGRTVSPKSTISCLEGILLRVGVGVQLTGYNLETGITVQLSARVSEPGICVMPARLFFDIVRKLPDDIVTVSVDERLQVSIRGGASSFKIAAMDAEEYPDLPDVDSNRAISIPQSALRDMIGGTIFSVSENQSRPIHTGCLIEVTNDSITMVAVDNSRLARRTWHSEEPIDRELKFVVPATGLREVEKILSDTDEAVKFTLGSKHILFEIGEVILVCRILEGEFIDWRRVVPTDNQIILTGRVDQLTASIERVSLIVSEKIKSPVRCTFGNQAADFRTTNTIGTAHDTCVLAGNGQELEIGFNCRYLLDALKAIPSEEVTLELRNGLSPLVFTPVDEKHDFSYMVLPVRLH